MRLLIARRKLQICMYVLCLCHVISQSLALNVSACGVFAYVNIVKFVNCKTLFFYSISFRHFHIRFTKQSRKSSSLSYPGLNDVSWLTSGK